MFIRTLIRHLITLLLTALLGGLMGAILVRLAPGFDSDERELDMRLQGASIHAVRESRRGEQNVLRFYGRYLAGVVHGDLGVSRSLGRPVTELLAERTPVTLGSVAIGLAGAWIFGFGVAVAGTTWRLRFLELFTTSVSGLLLCLPSGVLAILLLSIYGPVSVAVALTVAPRIFRYCENLLGQSYNLPHVMTARAKGLPRPRILLYHVVPLAGPQLLALAGVSVSMAFGAAIPLEVICDSPGIGQLAWQAAMGRDLPLLVTVTLLVTLVTLVVNFSADLLAKVWGMQPA